MDLERIKQNLRLRSGRTRKSKKAQVHPNPQPPTQAIPDAPVTRETQATPPAKADAANADVKEDGQKELPKAQPHMEPKTLGKQRPELRHAATGLPNGHTDQPPVDRYGRSGIDKPRKRSSHVPPPPQRTVTAPHNVSASDASDSADFDLRPPAARPKPPSLEATSELLFSAGHLNSLLQEPRSVARFTAFLNKYRPEFRPLILRYLETQKAIKAVEYANAIAEGAAHEEADAARIPSAAATLDRAFEEASASSFNSLVGTALPLYITYRLVKLVTECLINEITGNQTPMMHNLVGGLSEVFCLTDPKQEDNPIVYASEEFYRLTGYSTDDVIGHNCRFLQGSKTNRESPRRLRDSINKGEEHCETLLNYRRDGRPFINLLMIAPLHDDNGQVKYHIGAQVDVSGLIEGGRGLDGFEKYLQLQRNGRGRPKGNRSSESKQTSKALKKLQELSEMFDLEESAVVQTHSRASSMSRDDDTRSIGSSERRQRRVFVDSDQSDRDEDDERREDGDTWMLAASGPSGPSGKLPGVYDSYMLVRASPSLRIVFVSPKLRKIGNVIQNPFLAHVAAPATTLAGLKESFSTAVAVSAKINFMAEPGEQRDGTKTSPGTKLEDEKYGRVCWISATPLLGSDDRVGVWMVVIVQKSKFRRSTRTAEVEARIGFPTEDKSKPSRIEMPSRQSAQPQKAVVPHLTPEKPPIKPKRLDDLADDLPNHERAELEVRTGPEVDEPGPDNSDNPAEDAEFVQPKLEPQTPQRNGRIHIEPDSDDQDQSPDRHPVRESSNAASPTREDDRKYTPPPEIPASMQNATPPPQTPNLQVEDATPTRIRFDKDGQEDDSPAYQIAARHLPSDIMPMDYLRHPGSGNAAQPNIRDEDKWTDVDCMRSPTSVD